MFSNALAFLAGILLVQQFAELPPVSLLLGLGLLLLVLVLVRQWLPAFFVAGVVLVAVVAGNRLGQRLPQDLEQQEFDVTGRVASLPKLSKRSQRFNFVVDQTPALPINKIRLTMYDLESPVKAGQHWRFTVKLKRPHGRFNASGFDYEGWALQQNIGATGYVKKYPPPQLIRTESTFASVNNIRQMFADRLDVLLKNTQYKGLIKALTIGYRQELTDEQWNVFRRTGTVHLLAISGLHIGLIATLVYFLTLKLCVVFASHSPQKIAALLAIVAAVFYSCLAGFALSTQRALVVLTIVMASIIWQRNSGPRQTFATALLVVLIFDPLAVLASGFWLSFAAVALIIYVTSGRLGRRNNLYRAITVQLAITVGTAPIVLFYFQQASLLSPLANLLAVPVVAFAVVPFCLLGVCLLWLPTVATVMFDIADNVLQILYYLLEKVAASPVATLSLPTPQPYALALAILGVVLLLAPKGVGKKWLGLVLLLPLFVATVPKPSHGDVYVTLLDVGQGLATVVQTAKHLLVFDTGARYSRSFDMGDSVVVPFLKNISIKTIDTLLISHSDNDHIGGAKSIIQQLQVNKILTSAPKALDSDRPQLCQAGQSWEWDGVLFEVLSPIAKSAKRNNNSCVLMVSSHGRRLLLTGDIEKETEGRLVQHFGSALQADVLIAPHHGSNTSSTLAFLQQVNPSTVLIPAGYRNQYGFPRQQVLNRYRKINANTLNTADSGGITAKIENGQISLISLREAYGKYWNE